ncbi:MAG: hypothetical protein QM482_01905 [Sulfurospirillum sp.]
MLMILPFLVVILIIVAINHIYYSDVKSKNLKTPSHVEKKLDKRDTTQSYLDKYIKKQP